HVAARGGGRPGLHRNALRVREDFDGVVGQQQALSCFAAGAPWVSHPRGGRGLVVSRLVLMACRITASAGASVPATRAVARIISTRENARRARTGRWIALWRNSSMNAALNMESAHSLARNSIQKLSLRTMSDSGRKE